VVGVATGVGDGVRVGVGLVSPESQPIPKATSDMINSAIITNLMFYLLPEKYFLQLYPISPKHPRGEAPRGKYQIPNHKSPKSLKIGGFRGLKMS
jgi:hypothetical protein